MRSRAIRPSPATMRAGTSGRGPPPGFPSSFIVSPTAQCRHHRSPDESWMQQANRGVDETVDSEEAHRDNRIGFRGRQRPIHQPGGNPQPSRPSPDDRREGRSKLATICRCQTQSVSLRRGNTAGADRCRRDANTLSARQLQRGNRHSLAVYRVEAADCVAAHQQTIR